MSASATNAFHALSALVFPLPKDKAAPQNQWTLDQGVDIAAPAHTPLLAVGAGTIVHHGISGFGPDAVVLHLDTGENVYYGHAGPGNRLPDGTKVNAGQRIGEVGAGIVGISSGPHLEIGLSDAHGTPLGRQTAAGFKNALLHPQSSQSTLSKIISAPGDAAQAAGTAAAHAFNEALGLPNPDPNKSISQRVQEQGKDVGTKAQQEAAKLAGDAVKGVLGDIFNTHAIVAALLAILGLALAGYGAARTFGVQQPVASAMRGARGVAGVAAVA
jgi:hypothetical protein